MHHGIVKSLNRRVVKSSVLPAAGLWLVVSLYGCEKPPVVVTPGAPAPAVVPLASYPASGKTIQLSQGIDLAQIANQQMIHPQFSIDPATPDTQIVFATLQNEQKKATAPVILKKFPPAWKILELTDAPQTEWSYVALGPGDREIWAVLDAAGEDEETDHLTLLHSTDAGNSFQYSVCVKKPTPAAEYSGFSMAKSGQGRLTMHLAEDDEQISHGFYHYTTTDSGRTFRGPTFEPDDTTEADNLKSSALKDALK